MTDTEKKLQEANYFLKCMLKTHAIPFEFECNLQAFISSARSVTFVMQTEYSKKPDFRKWYEEKQDEMRADGMLSFFHDLRTKIIHKKPLNVGSITHIKNILINSTPKGWGFAITGKGEPTWITPTGESIHAFEFDNQIDRIYLFDSSPKNFLGSNIQNFSVVTLCRLYFGYLSQLVNEALKKFEES
jgi:hypothetical protein